MGKKSLKFNLINLIGNEPHWTFPLNKARLDILLQEDDFKAVFWFAIQKMKESNIQFSSPGNSYGRKFTYWFNSHFWEEDFNPPAFARQDFLFNESLKLLKKHIQILF